MCLKCYPLLIADVFENFRNNRLKNYGSCSSRYMDGLALRWDAMLNMTKVELEFIPDPYMYLFFEKSREVEFHRFLREISPTIIM